MSVLLWPLRTVDSVDVLLARSLLGAPSASAKPKAKGLRNCLKVCKAMYGRTICRLGSSRLTSRAGYARKCFGDLEAIREIRYSSQISLYLVISCPDWRSL